MKWIDNFLNRITMYKLLFYSLLILLGIAELFSIIGWIGYKPLDLAFSVVFISVVSWVTNRIFAWAFDAPFNPESTWITAFILALIITPPQGFQDILYYSLAFCASALAIGSKYILAIRKKHLFNPAALGVALTLLFLNQSASWWVGTASLLPFTLIIGFLVTRKIRRGEMVTAFLISALVSILVLYEIHGGGNVAIGLEKALVEAPLIFMSTIMLTEPLTSPTTKDMQIVYGVLCGLLMSPYVHIGSIYSTPELVLLVGNVFSYIVSSKAKLILQLKDRIRLSPDTFEFVFHLNNPLAFAPGQYMEFTLPHAHADSRGIRRYFTISSSPSDRDELRLGVKFNNQDGRGSSFKKALMELQPSQKTMVGTYLAGDFVMPEQRAGQNGFGKNNRRVVWIAGGIGITPFVSMVKYLLAKGQPAKATLIYSNRNAESVAYKKLFDYAAERIGLQTVYTLTGEDVPTDWQGLRGRINAQMIRTAVPDFLDSEFYMSGTQGLVDSAEKLLESMGVPHKQIHKDFFPGL